MKRIIASLAFLAVAISLMAQKPTTTIRIWSGTKPPTSNGLTGNENNFGNYVTNVTTPTLAVYVPEKCNGKAVISCPGGAYTAVWLGTEGHPYASWFLERGYTYAVLKYRLPNGHPTVPLEDLQQAITIMRSRAAEWGDYSCVGVMGSSAGGHLAATAATHYTDDVTRPDFQILCYPVTSFQDGLAHEGTRNALLGSDQSDEMKDYYSNELQVTGRTPRAFIVHAADDQTVTPSDATVYADALMKKGVVTSLHIYPSGDHGCTTNAGWKYRSLFFSELEDFLSDIPVKPTVEGDAVTYTFDEFENEYTVYSINPSGVSEAGGVLTAANNAEHKIIFESETPMNEFEVSCDIKVTESNVNAGLYVLGSNIKNAADMITCYNVHLERFNGAGEVTPRIFRFSGDSGYLGTVASGPAYEPQGDFVNLKVVCKDNVLYVYLDNSSDACLVYNLPEGLSGDVGLRSQWSNSVFDNFTVKSAQYQKKGTSSVAAPKSDTHSDTVYNLLGVRVEKPVANGVYIANGTKTIGSR